MLFKLQDDCVEICYAHIEDFHVLTQDFAKTLSQDELEKADNFIFPNNNRDFIVCRGLLRHLLGSYLNISPSKLKFQYGPYGKPQLPANIPEPVYFNLSHSGGLVAFVICLNKISGIDLEYIRPMTDMLGVVENFFSEQEQRKLRNLPDCDKLEAFFRIWTYKEACLKAVGTGLSYPLNQVEIAIDREDISCEVILTEDKKNLSSTLMVRSLNPGFGYTGALALGKEDESLKDGAIHSTQVQEAWLTADSLGWATISKPVVSREIRLVWVVHVPLTSNKNKVTIDLNIEPSKPEKFPNPTEIAVKISPPHLVWDFYCCYSELQSKGLTG